MKVVLADVEDSALAAEALKKGAPVLAVRWDVSKAAEVEQLADRAYSRFGAVNVLCNNAGVGMGPSAEATVEDWQWVLGVISGRRRHSHVRAADARRPDGGHIVNTASVAGLVLEPHMAVYQATKHAVVTVTESLKMELDLSGGRSELRCSALASSRPGSATQAESARRRQKP
jgi:NAD(P)-dependent dehydrogenase (short-subunit alcohol dehydrogenase family)